MQQMWRWQSQRPNLPKPLLGLQKTWPQCPNMSGSQALQHLQR